MRKQILEQKRKRQQRQPLERNKKTKSGKRPFARPEEITLSRLKNCCKIQLRLSTLQVS
jgi:hypothetical protein